MKKVHDQRNARFNQRLMEKWGYKRDEDWGGNKGDDPESKTHDDQKLDTELDTVQKDYEQIGGEEIFEEEDTERPLESPLAEDALPFNPAEWAAKKMFKKARDRRDSMSVNPKPETGMSMVPPPETGMSREAPTSSKVVSRRSTPEEIEAHQRAKAKDFDDLDLHKLVKEELEKYFAKGGE